MRLDPSDPRLGSSRRSASGWPRTARTREAVERAVGPDRAADAQPAGRAGVAGARRVRVPHRAAGERRRRRHRLSRAARCSETIGEPARARAGARRGRGAARLARRAPRADARTAFEVHGARPTRSGLSADGGDRGACRTRARRGAARARCSAPSARAGARQLGGSPIVNLHVVYRPARLRAAVRRGRRHAGAVPVRPHRRRRARRPGASTWRCRCRAPSGRCG